MAKISRFSSNSAILDVLHQTADSVAVVLQNNQDWSLSGIRETQYSVDLRCDVAALEVLHGAGMAVLSEESQLTGEFGQDDLLVVIDPLDGSTNASRGVPWYATALCAIDHSGMRASLVANQAKSNDRYWATLGGGAFHNHKLMQPSKCVELDHSIIGISGSPAAPPKWAQFRALGASALDICLVADGVLDGWIDFNSHGVWDYLASLLICQESGTCIVEHFGRELVVSQYDARRTPIVAATPELLADLKTIRDQNKT